MSERIDTLVRRLLGRAADRPRLRRAVLWCAAFLHEADRNSVLIRAATLIYPTLLSIVPVLAVVFAVMDIIGGDAAARVANLTVGLFLAEAVSPVGAQLEAMLSGVNFAGLGVAGLLGVLVTSASVYFRVEHTYNALWNTRSRRKWPVRATMFYTVLTLGPLFLVWGFHYSDVIRALPGWGWIAFASPVLVTVLVFIAPIRLIPDTQVNWIPAIIGGTFSASLFELAKVAFSAYFRLIGSADTVTQIYGSLGLFPVFLVWLFLAWTIVLVGVELAYCVHRRDDLIAAEERRLRDQADRPRHADALFAVQCLLVVARRYIQGEGPTTEPQVTQLLETDPAFVAEALETLEVVGVLVESPVGYVPAFPLDRLTLADVLAKYRERTRPQSASEGPGADVVARVLTGAERLDVSIAALASGPEEPAVAAGV